MGEFRIYGIDPAPRKGLHVFDGETDTCYKINEAADFLAELKEEENVLICWDAPLTGPPLSVVDDATKANAFAFTQRRIEKFFSQKVSGFKAPQGISVRPYSGCPHWTISKALIGLPRVGIYDRDDLPFRLVFSQKQNQRQGHLIVEVHPALALWLWCRERMPEDTLWEYKEKKKPEILRSVWGLFHNVARENGISLPSGDKDITDDKLDARVAYALGHLWIHSSEQVVLLGNEETGAILVPKVKGIEDAFAKFGPRKGKKKGCLE